MSINYCEKCDTYIDTDIEEEHECKEHGDIKDLYEGIIKKSEK